MNYIRLESVHSKKRYSGPSSWNELTRKQLFVWSGIIRQRIPIEYALKSALILFYKVPLKLFNLLTPAQRVELTQTLSFLTDKNELTKNVIGSFRLFLTRYHGPSSRLSNLTISEYRRTELYYQLWHKTTDGQYLDLLAATLFRPKGNQHPDDDVRAPIVELDLQKRASRFKWLNPTIRHSILLFYEGCRFYVIDKHPKIFKSSKKEDKGGLFDFEEVILAVSGSKFGTFEETKNTNLYLFLQQLVDRMEEAEELKRKRK